MTNVRARLLGRREDSLAVQSVILTAARVLGFALTFAIPIVLVRVFNQETFGTYKQLFLIAGTAVPILNMGIYASLFYFVPRDIADGHRYILQSIGLLLVTGGLAGLVLVAAPGWIAELLNKPTLTTYLPLIGLFVFVATPSEMVNSVPVVDRRPVLAAYTMTGSDLLRATAIVGTAVVTQSLRSVLWAVIAVAILRGVWLAVYIAIRRAPRSHGRISFDLRGQLRYALPFAAAVVFEIGLARFHEYYVAAHVSSATFAVYAVGLLQIPLLGMLVQSVVEVMLPRMAEAYKASDLVEMRRVWYAAIERVALLIVPCWAIALVLSRDLIGFLFGQEYLASVPIFRIFISVFLLLIIIDHSVLRATGDTGFVLRANAVGFAVSAVVVALLAPFSILLGGVIGYVTGMVVMRSVGLTRVARRLQLRWSEVLPVGTLGKIFTAATGASIVALLAFPLSHPLLRLAAGGILFAGSYGAIVLRWEVVPRAELTALARRFLPSTR